MGSAIMFQGTASHVGKTTLVAAMCRLLADMGYRVAPFKAQNMSLNSYVTADGHEIARAQALQAFAARVAPEVDMNPILLKPKGGGVSQVVLRGKPYMDIGVGPYYAEFALGVGLRVVEESIRRLLSRFDVVVIEGAGSAAEPNLYDRDIANMRVARIARSPVLLVADIDLGGAFASILGTLDILREEDRELVKGFVINKFRGDRTILEPAIRYLEERTHRRVVGVIPHLGELALPSEDSLSIRGFNPAGKVDVAVLRLPSISNFTDIEALALNGAAKVRYVSGAQDLGSPHLVVLPGSKNTVEDLAWLRSTGLFGALRRYVLRDEGWVVGVCGGYEMLGKRIVDPHGIEGLSPGTHEGLGLLDVETRFEEYRKVTRLVEFRFGKETPTILKGLQGVFEGYEIRMGRTLLGRGARPLVFARPKGSGGEWEVAGAWSPNHRVFGTSIHGFFDDPQIAQTLLVGLGGPRGGPGAKRPEQVWDEQLNRLAEVLRANMDLEYVFGLMGLGSTPKGRV